MWLVICKCKKQPTIKVNHSVINWFELIQNGFLWHNISLPIKLIIKTHDEKQNYERQAAMEQSSGRLLSLWCRKAGIPRTTTKSELGNLRRWKRYSGKSSAKNQGAHLGLGNGNWFITALEVRKLRRELGKTQGQRPHPSSIETSQAHVPQWLYRYTKPGYSRVSETHWNGQDLQVFWNRNGVSLQIEIKLDTLLVNIDRALRASRASHLSHDYCSELLMPTSHSGKTYSGFPALRVILVGTQAYCVHALCL